MSIDRRLPQLETGLLSRRGFFVGATAALAAPLSPILTAGAAFAATGYSPLRFNSGDAGDYFSDYFAGLQRDEMFRTFVDRATASAGALGSPQVALKKYIRMGEEAIYSAQPTGGFWPQVIRGITGVGAAVLETAVDFFSAILTETGVFPLIDLIYKGIVSIGSRLRALGVGSSDRSGLIIPKRDKRSATWTSQYSGRKVRGVEHKTALSRIFASSEPVFDELSGDSGYIIGVETNRGQELGMLAYG